MDLPELLRRGVEGHREEKGAHPESDDEVQEIGWVGSPRDVTPPTHTVTKRATRQRMLCCGISAVLA